MRTLIALHYIVLWLLLTGCQTIASAAGHPTGDTRDWQTHRVQVDDKIVEFEIPLGQSKAFPVFSIPTKLDLAGSDSFNAEGLGQNLLRRFWDYSSSRFRQSEGTLGAVIALRESAQDIVDIESLKRAVFETSRRFEEKAGVSPEAQDLPMNYREMTVGGKKVVGVTYKISPPSYVFSLDQRHYLEVSFQLSDFTSRPDWRGDAQAAADAVLNSIRIRSAH